MLPLFAADEISNSIQIGQAGSVVALVGALVWVFRTAIPAIEGRHAAEREKSEALTAAEREKSDARMERLFNKVLTESDDNRRFIADEMAKRDAVLKTMVDKIDNLAAHVGQCPARIPILAEKR